MEKQDVIRIAEGLRLIEEGVETIQGVMKEKNIKSLKEDEIGPFALSPRGIQFAFAPYAVGPYSDGAFFVTVAFNDLQTIIDPKGPLSEFIGATREAQKE